MSYRHPDSTPAGNFGSAFAMRQDALWKVKNDETIRPEIRGLRIKNIYLNLNGSITEISSRKHQATLERIDSISSTIDIHTPELKHKKITHKGIKKLKEVLDEKELSVVKKFTSYPNNRTIAGKYMLSLVFLADFYKDTPLDNTANAIKKIINGIKKPENPHLFNHEKCDELSNEIFSSIIATEPVEPLNYAYRINYLYRTNVIYQINTSFDKMSKKPDFQQADEIYDSIKEHYDKNRLALESDPLLNKMIKNYYIINYTHNLANKVDKMLFPSYSLGNKICNIT